MNKNSHDIVEDPAFIDFIRFWAEKNVTRPIRGFEQMRGNNGSSLSEMEQLSQTHDQILDAANYFYGKGRPVHEIIEILSFFKK